MIRELRFFIRQEDIVDMEKQVEILAPAGSYDSLVAAIAAGADAVYIGGTRFGARAYADNLDTEKMLQAIDYVHLHGKKIYLTVNTLLKDNELEEELYTYLLPYYKQGIDAVIVQDIGVLSFMKEQFPDLPIHASTQMTITNVYGAKLLEELGVERVVTSRELQINEIEEISKKTNLEIESFVHGALCYSYSGQCLFSSMLGGRSGNRGQCAQPCRLPYVSEGTKKNQYLLSLKDMCTLEYIPELIEAGIFSFKIEGRMKKPEYVALVTAMYRKYVDLYFEVGKEKYFVDAKDKEMLMDLYNRGGFCGGYYKEKNGPGMLSITRPNHAGVAAIRVTGQNGKQLYGKALVDIHKGDVIEITNDKETYTFGYDVLKGQNIEIVTRNKQNVWKGQVLNRTRNESLIRNIQETIIQKEAKEVISGEFFIEENKPMELVLTYKDSTVKVTGETAQIAKSQPMDKARLEKQLRKTGGTPFVFGDLKIQTKGNVFVPMQSINELRRKGLEILENTWLEQYRRPLVEKIIQQREVRNTSNNSTNFYVSVETIQQWEEAVQAKNVSRIYLDSSAIDDCSKMDSLIQKTHKNGKEIFFAMPHIFRKNTITRFEAMYSEIFSCDWDGVLIRNYESLSFLKSHNFLKNIVTDSNLYVFNRYAKTFWKMQGVEHTTAPLELNVKELNELGIESCELIVYGYTPMMISAQCIQETCNGCDRTSKQIKMQDRYKKEFVVKNFCDYCYNIIYNSNPTVLLDQKDEIAMLNPKALRMNFTIEDGKTTREVLKLFDDYYECNKQVSTSKLEFTRGHFRRGIK